MLPTFETHPEADPEAGLPAIPLSETELEVLALVATGATNREVAHQRGISEATVKKHLSNINGKLGTGNRTEAVRRAFELGLVKLPGPDEPAQSTEVAARLAAELERTRRGARRAVRLTAAVAAVLVTGAAALAWSAWTAGDSDPVGEMVTAVRPEPADPVWLPSKRLPGPRSGLALVALGEEVLAVGGRSPERVLADTLRFGELDDPDWVRLSDKPTPVSDAGAVRVGGEVIVPGGCDYRGRATDRTEAYDPSADSWRSLAPMPESLCAYGIAALDGKVYVLGGRSGPTSETASDAVHVYSRDADSWTTLPLRLPDRRSDLQAVVLESRNEVRLIGGRDAAGNLERSHWILRPFSERDPWDTDTAPQLPDGRAGHAMAALTGPLARIYVVGGGWDGRARPETLQLDLDAGVAGGWRASSSVPGVTPQRGAAMAVAGRNLYLVGGSADGTPNRNTFFLEPFPVTLLFPR